MLAPLDQLQQHEKTPSFAPSMSVKVPPSSNLAFNIAKLVPIASYVVQSLIVSDVGDAICSLLWSIIMNDVIFMHQEHDLIDRAIMIRTELVCIVQVNG